MKRRAACFYGAALLGFVAIIVVAVVVLDESGPALGAILIGWFVVVGVLQLAVLRCPHCGGIAVITPYGPFVGSNCRYCGRRY